MEEPTKKSEDSLSLPQTVRAKRSRVALFRLWQMRGQRSIRTIRIVTVDLAVIVVAILLLYTLAHELLNYRTEIDPIDVPESLSKEGLTPHLAAQSLANQILKIKVRAETTMKKRETTLYLENQPDVVVPGLGLSLTSIAYYLRDLVGDRVTHVSGYISELPLTPSTHSYALHLSINKEPFRALPGVKIDQLDTMWQTGAEAYLHDVEPYFVSSYYYSLGQRERSASVAREIISGATEVDENVLRAQNLLGIILGDQFKYDEAITKFKEVISLAGSRFSVRKFSVPYAYDNLGNALTTRAETENGNLDEAIAAFRTAIAIDPEFAAPYSDLCSALNAAKKYDEAIYECQLAIDLDPKFAEAYINLGEGLIAKGQEDEALAKFQKAIEVDPKNAVTYAFVGYSLWKAGHGDEALAKFQNAIEIDSKYAPTYEALGQALGAKHHRDEAVANFQKAIELKPRDLYAYNLLGVALIDKHKYDEAIAAFRTAIAIDSKFEDPYLNLGYVLFLTSQFSLALATYDDLLKINPKSVAALNGRGYSKKSNGDAAGAEADFAAASNMQMETDPAAIANRRGLKR